MPERHIDFLNRQRVKQPTGAAARRFKPFRRKAYSFRNIMALPEDRAGIYLYYDKDGRLLWVGHGSERGVKARIVDEWYRRGDWRTPEKMKCRDEIAKFDVIWGDNVFDNYELEMKLKQKAIYNRR